ncbi:MAG: o-succinylbenzoate synthase, partial [Flavobacteriaceae bacterium]
MQATYQRYVLNFKQASGTSRGVLKTKETFFLVLQEGAKIGYGETGLFRGLSADDVQDYEEKLQWACAQVNQGLPYLLENLKGYPSIQFGLEQAFLSLASDHPFHLFSTPFVTDEAPININGLVWMGEIPFMEQQIEDKLVQGFTTIKLKIGALDFEKECRLLEAIRTRFSKEEIQIRVDANGAFTPENALEKLERLARFDIHSIEQPIRQGQIAAMQELCLKSPLPIALDEELIGVFDKVAKEALLQKIQPQYIILKPSLVGGIGGSQEWITLAEKYGIDWWITSALESNIGLNAIAQWTSTLEATMPQGLGTGGLFTN